MLKIKLARYGKKHEPHYRLIVAEARSRRQGKPVDTLGFWAPKTGEIRYDKKRFDEWLTKGAKPADGVKNLMEKQASVSGKN